MISASPEVKIKSFATLFFIFFQDHESELPGLSRKEKVPKAGQDLVYSTEKEVQSANEFSEDLYRILDFLDINKFEIEAIKN